MGWLISLFMSIAKPGRCEVLYGLKDAGVMLWSNTLAALLGASVKIHLKKKAKGGSKTEGVHHLRLT